MAAFALRIRREYGPLYLLNARDNPDHPLLIEINQRNFDLDEGMVILCNGRFYHGQSALVFMARHGDTGWFNRVNKALFQSEWLARVTYPWMRATRNLLLKLKGGQPINNLCNAHEPVFKPVFGDAWPHLPKVMQRHYANRAYRDDVATVEGTLQVESSVIGRLLKPVFLLTGVLVPYEGKDVPVTVNFISESRSNAFRFERTFSFPGRRPYKFLSKMVPRGGNEIVELMGPGLGWRSAYSWNGEKVVLAHRGYVISVLGALLPVPLTFLLGSGYAEEIPIDDDTFSMMTEIRHPLWGRIFGYNGTFKITKDA